MPSGSFLLLTTKFCYGAGCHPTIFTYITSVSPTVLLRHNQTPASVPNALIEASGEEQVQLQRERAPAAAAKGATPSATHTHGGDSLARDCTLPSVTALDMWVRIPSWVHPPSPPRYHQVASAIAVWTSRSVPLRPFHPPLAPRLRGSTAAR